MAKIVLKNVSKTYDNGVKALKNVDLTVEEGEFLVLLGPSGCGKSTMLRVIAGLEKITDGNIEFNDEVYNDVPPKGRNVAMVFQNFALYPHLNVYKNIAFPLKSTHVPAEEIKRRVEKTAALLDITHVLNRRPKHLSGGQRQRVALGRAMVREPVVFLLDEPLSNLDAKMRLELRDEICKLHKSLNTAFVYVTHDQAEAMHMGTRIVVMNEGVIVQSGTPQEVYNFPNSLYVAGFVGSPKMNFFASRLYETESGWAVQVMGKKIPLPAERLPKDTKNLAAGMKVVVGVRPEDFRPAQSAEAVTFDCTVGQVIPMGAGTHVNCQCGNQKFLAVLLNHTNVLPGSDLKLSLDPWCIHVFDAETENALFLAATKEETV